MSGRSRKILFIGIVVAGFLLLDPFGLFSDRGPRRPGMSRQEIAPYVAHAEEAARPADDFVLDYARKHQVVFLGTLGHIRQHVEFLIELAPQLPAAGVDAIAINLVRAKDQEELNSLIGAGSKVEPDGRDGHTEAELQTEFDEATARRLLFQQNVFQGYREYLELLEAVWRHNRDSAPGDALELIALSPEFRYEHIRTQEDTQDPAVYRKVLPDGAPDDFMYEVLRAQAIERDRRVVAFLTFPHAFTRFRSPALADEMQRLGFDTELSVGNQIYREIGDRTATLFLHGPWPDERLPSNMNYGAEGRLDAILDHLPPEERAAGFTIPGTPLAELPIETGQYAEGYDALTLGDLTDGYVFLESLAGYRGLRVLPDFINEENVEEARERFPGPHPGDRSADELQEFFRGEARAFDQSLTSFD